MLLQRSCTKLGLLGLGLSIILTQQLAAAETVRLDRIPHIHGIEVSRTDPTRLYLATHQGLYLASPDGTAEKVSASSDDLMGFVAHPTSPEIVFASGHPPAGGNLGVIRSEDGGTSWSQLSKGVNGPVDFHAMDVSKADTKVIYGMHDGLQISRDGGRSWTLQGPLPGETFDLAASAVDPETVYAATREGLKLSRDAGKTWQPAHIIVRPSTMVYTAADSTAYAFIIGVGLVKTQEPSLAWTPVSSGFGKHFLLHLVSDPENPSRLFAVADTGGIVMSKDEGKTWIGYEGSDRAAADRIARGAQLYKENCQSCHGVKGAGEPPEHASGADGNPAPALDDTAHAWHHPDSDLVNAILEGFEHRGSRMPGWKDVLTREQAEDIVAYFKSLWSFRSYACQGARHMACGAHGRGN